MILADKIILLRKKMGWSQEELANQINVSRQAVSKWEGAQSVPDLEKILQLSMVFGVTTDYLLKDEIEGAEFSDTDAFSDEKKISIEEANEYINLRKRSSIKIALATVLCILSPITLIILGAASEEPYSIVSETFAGIVGLGIMFLFILCAVPIFIYCGFENESYDFLDKNVSFTLQYGVKGFVEQKKKDFRRFYVTSNIIATGICMFSALPLILLGFTENDMLSVIMLAAMMVIAGIGVAIFITVGIRNAAFEKLLKEGDYTEKEKKRRSISEPVGFFYWSSVVAVFLVWSFITGDWHLSWISLMVGGILFAPVIAICNMISDKKHK